MNYYQRYLRHLVRGVSQNPRGMRTNAVTIVANVLNIDGRVIRPPAFL